MIKTRKRIFILMANPHTDSRTNRIANAYEKGAREAGHEVRRQNISEMKFDPILHKGYTVIQNLEPDLLTFQENVKWSEHFVVLYPNWWATMPALLKGLIDRAWLPGFAFRFRKTSPGWDRLLKGRSARIFILANTHPWITWSLFGDFTNELERATLAFSGFDPIRTKVFAPSEKAPGSTWLKWEKTVFKLGYLAK